MWQFYRLGKVQIIFIFFKKKFELEFRKKKLKIHATSQRVSNEGIKKNHLPAGRFCLGIILENTVGPGYEGAKKNPFRF